MKFVRFETSSRLYARELALREKILRAPLGMTLTPEFLKSDVDDLHFCLLSDSKEMIACLLIKRLSAACLKLRQMAVAEDEQGEGLGTLLIKETEASLKMERGSSMELHARTSAVNFYIKSGFSSVGEEFSEIGILHMKMIKHYQQGTSR